MAALRALWWVLLACTLATSCNASTIRGWTPRVVEGVAGGAVTHAASYGSDAATAHVGTTVLADTPHARMLFLNYTEPLEEARALHRGAAIGAVLLLVAILICVCAGVGYLVYRCCCCCCHEKKASPDIDPRLLARGAVMPVGQMRSAELVATARMVMDQPANLPSYSSMRQLATHPQMQPLSQPRYPQPVRPTGPPPGPHMW